MSEYRVEGHNLVAGYQYCRTMTLFERDPQHLIDATNEVIGCLARAQRELAQSVVVLSEALEKTKPDPETLRNSEYLKSGGIHEGERHPDIEKTHIELMIDQGHELAP